LIDEGTAEPTLTVTVMVCGASATVGGAFTVRIAVCIPAVSEEVFKAIVIGMQLETVKMVVQAPALPTVALAQLAEEVTDVSVSVPSPAL
jgi:hypothetical protein